MAASLLASLKVAAGPVKGQPKATKAKVAVEGLETYAALSMVAKEITDGFLKNSEVKTGSMQHFMELGRALGKTPENYSGEDGAATTASMQLRKKDSRTKLKPDEVERFESFGISYGIQENRPATVRVKPDYFRDQPAMLEKLLLLAKKAGMPDDLFEIQTSDAYPIVGESTTDDIFAMAKASDAKDSKLAPMPEDVIMEMLTWAAGVTINPKFGGTLTEAVAIARRELAPTTPMVKTR